MVYNFREHELISESDKDLKGFLQQAKIAVMMWISDIAGNCLLKS